MSHSTCKYSVANWRSKAALMQERDLQLAAQRPAPGAGGRAARQHLLLQQRRRQVQQSQSGVAIQLIFCHRASDWRSCLRTMFHAVCESSSCSMAKALQVIGLLFRGCVLEQCRLQRTIAGAGVAQTPRQCGYSYTNEMAKICCIQGQRSHLPQFVGPVHEVRNS